MPDKDSSPLARFLNFQELSAEERRSVLEDLFVFGRENQFPYFVRMAVLLVLSTIIAAAGLLSDSAAVVIGAMLVAPLMNPVLGAAAAVVMGWSKRFYQSLWLVAAMAIGALLISSLITLVSPELVIIPEQVLARTRPTFYDLLIALAAGSAGAYTITRKESGAIPGVAVAVALLPPLASAGILATTGEAELAFRALVLFLTNLVAMVLAGALTFLAVGVSPGSARRYSSSFIQTKLWMFFLLTVTICVPLYFYSEKIIFNAHYKAAKSQVLQHWLQENNLELADVDISIETRTLWLELVGPTAPINIEQLYTRLVETHDIDASLGFNIEYTWTLQDRGKWPLEEKSLEQMAEELRGTKTSIFLKPWTWTGTQYAQGRAAVPSDGEAFSMIVEPAGDIKITAGCGSWKGEFAYTRQEISIEMKRNLFSGCRKDQEFQLFIGDLGSAREMFIQDDQLKIILAGGTSTMTFRKND